LDNFEEFGDAEEIIGGAWRDSLQKLANCK